MTRPIFVTVAASLLLTRLAYSGDNSRSVAQWVEEYKKLGGEAFVVSGDSTAVGVQRKTGQTPIVRLSAVKPSEDVRKITLQGFGITDQDISDIAQWRRLESVVVIDGKGVSDVGVKALANMSGLNSISLSETAATGDGIRAFSRHAKLKALELNNTILPTALQKLTLEDVPELEKVLLNCEGLTEIRLNKMPKLRLIEDMPSTLKTLKLFELPSLTELDCEGTQVKLIEINGMPKLTALDLKKTFVPDETIESIKKLNPKVQIKR